MALQLTFTHPGNKLVAINAYHRLASVSFLDKTSVYLIVRVFKSSVESGDDSTPVSDLTFSFTKDLDQPTWDTYFSVAAMDTLNQNYLERGYEYLKTLPEYAGALDV